MATIQEIREMEDRIIDAVQELIDNGFDESDGVAVNWDAETAIGAAKEICSADEEFLPIASLLRKDSDGQDEPDIDAIGDIVSENLFLGD